MKKVSIGKNNKLLKRAKTLRKEMTKEERHLWYDFLRGYSPKVYKQRIIDNYIVDFYCDKAKLVIELDGSQHYSENGENYDKQRTKYLESLGLKVVRFSNLDVTDNFYSVCYVIDKLIKERAQIEEEKI